jgi:hypothetical protein
MSTKITALTQGIVDLINTPTSQGTLSHAITATRRYLPILNLEEITGLVCTVVPREDARELLTRARFARQVVVDVGVQARLPAGTDPEKLTGNTEIDSLVQLCEEIADLFPPDTTVAACTLTAISYEPVYVPDHLIEGVFTGVLHLTFKMY